MLQLLHTIAGLALPASRSRLKLAVRGGILRLSGDELSFGRGLFGSRELRRVPLAAITAIEVEPGLAASDGLRLHIRSADGELLVAGVSPLSASRLQTMLRALQAGQPPGGQGH
jgi:hypothetical protein